MEHPAREGAKIPALGRILIGLLPLVVLVGAMETGLWALGLGEPPTRANTSRGFDATAQYLVPDSSTPGAWRTQVYDEPEAELLFPPKGDATRVLLVGGSNTKLFPEDLLEQSLDEDSARAGSTQRWEVLNIGRPGYGSERVRIYLEQAMVLHPDIVVIYAGHNEFVEATFAHELGRDEPEEDLPWQRRAAETFRGLRSFNLLEDAFAAGGAGSSAWSDGDTRVSATAPEPWVPLAPGDFDLRPEATRRHYDAFENNLASMVETAREAGARVLLCTPLSNMLTAPSKLYPKRWADYVGVSRTEIKEVGVHLRAAKLRVPERFRTFFTDPVHLRVFNWYGAFTEGLADTPYEPPTFRALGPPLDVAPAADGGRNAASIEGAHWPDPQQWGLAPREYLPDVARLMARDISPQERTLLEESAGYFRETVELSHQMPEQIFALATVLYLLGEDEEAAHHFRLARDLDPGPRAASSQILDAIRSLAAARDDVQLLDSAAIFTAADPQGIPGYEMLMDGCHLQPGLRVALMHLLADELREMAGE